MIEEEEMLLMIMNNVIILKRYQGTPSVEIM